MGLYLFLSEKMAYKSVCLPEVPVKASTVEMEKEK